MSGRLLSTTVIVRNVRDNIGLGVEFLDMSDEDQSELRYFVEGQAARVA
jgi:hypothetical protein